jgi:hypothetical protein
MIHNGSLEDNVKALLRANLLRGPVDLMSEVMVLARTLQQKFPMILRCLPLLRK